jgi:hypothetical protein
MTARPEPNHLVVLNLFQHLVCFFLPSADASFIPVPAYWQAQDGVFRCAFNKPEDQTNTLLRSPHSEFSSPTSDNIRGQPLTKKALPGKIFPFLSLFS